jgi:hypothetical protein
MFINIIISQGQSSSKIEKQIGMLLKDEDIYEINFYYYYFYKIYLKYIFIDII